MAKKMAAENLWDDDFDEADIEESIFKASQVCNPPNAAAKPKEPSTSALEIERQEIQKLLQDPTLLNEDPNNIFSADDAFSQVGSHQNNLRKAQPQQQAVHKDDNFDNFFDSFDGIDPDLLSSQPIPGTQPRQRWQRCGSGNNLSPNKNPVVAVNQAASTSKAISSSNSSTVSRGIAQNVSAKQSSTISMRPPQSASASSSIPNPQANLSKHGLSSISSRNKFQQSGAFQPQKSLPGTSHDQNSSHNVPSNHAASNHAPVVSNGEDIQTIQKKAWLQEQELKKKLLQSQQGQSDMEREMMTKKGEISCLRNELQRKALALDTERLARVSAADVHKKELQDKVAAATRETQSKSRALEKRLEKLHSDMAFKNREITELITKCKKMEQVQMHQQKRFQDHLSQQEQMLSQQIASSQEMERHHQQQLMNQTTVMEDGGRSPPFLPPPLKGTSSSTASKKDSGPCASTSRKFPADRFDFTDREPPAAKQAGGSRSSSSKQAPTTAIPDSVQQQLESLQQEFAAKQLAQEREGAPEDVVVIEGIVVDCQKGFYKASLECIALLDRLSNGDQIHNPMAEASALVSVSGSARERLILDTVSRGTEHHQVVDLNEKYGFTSVIKPRARDNTDVLLDEDCEGRYCDDYTSWERETAAVEGLKGANSLQEGSAGRRKVKEEAVVKKEPVDVGTRKDDEDNPMEVDSDGTEYDEVTGARIGFSKLFNTAYNKKVEIERNAAGGQVWDTGFLWSDEQVALQAAEKEKLDANVEAPLGSDVSKSSSDESWQSEGSHTSVTHVEALPQEWVTLLSFMAKDDNLCRHEKLEDEDMLSDEELETDVCGPDIVSGDSSENKISNQKRKNKTNNPRIQCEDKDPRHSSDHAKKRRQQLALAPNLGQFLYDLTQEMLEDNIRDLNYSNNHGMDDEVQDAAGEMREVAGDKTPVSSRKRKKEGKTNRGSGAVAKEDIVLSDAESDEENNLLAGIRLHFNEADTLPGEHTMASDKDCSSVNSTSNHRSNYTSATRRLFYSVLEWLALEATYFRNVEKGIINRRSKERDDSQFAIQKTALTILEHLLPLRFDCGHLPAPMIVLGYILYPKEMARQVACTISTSVLSCMRVCAGHPSTLMTPEMALLLVDRLCRACRHLSSARELDSLLQCLETLGQHRIFMQTVCGMAEECLVGQVCVSLLDLCSEPYSENTQIRRYTTTTARRARPVTVTSRTGFRSPVMVESQTDRCLRSFFRWLVGVLLARPAWLLGECQCCLVLLATLLVITHTEVYQLVKSLPMIHAIKERCCAMHQCSSTDENGDTNKDIKNDAICKTKDALASNSKAVPRASRSKSATADNISTVDVSKNSTVLSTTVTGNTSAASSNQTTLVNQSTRSCSVTSSTLLCHAAEGGKASTIKTTNTHQRSSNVPPGAASTSKLSVSTCSSNAAVGQMSCSVCNTETLCHHACSCSGLCGDYYDEGLFDVHSRLGCRCKHVWAALRVLKLFLSVDERGTMHTASVPHYTLLAKLLAEALPFFAPLSDPETGKLVARLH